MPIGTVKWFSVHKGFGFLVDAEGRDVFIHFTAIEGEGFRRLRDGQQVEFELVRGPKGLSAAKVRRIGPWLDLDGDPHSDGRRGHRKVDGQARPLPGDDGEAERQPPGGAQ